MHKIKNKIKICKKKVVYYAMIINFTFKNSAFFLFIILLDIAMRAFQKIHCRVVAGWTSYEKFGPHAKLKIG